MSFRQPQAGDDSSSPLCVTTDHHLGYAAKPVVVSGVCMALVYRAAHPGESSTTAGIVGADGANRALCVGETGVKLLWEETVADYTVIHRGLILLGAGGGSGMFYTATTKAGLPSVASPALGWVTAGADENRMYWRYGDASTGVWYCLNFLEVE